MITKAVLIDCVIFSSLVALVVTFWLDRKKFGLDACQFTETDEGQRYLYVMHLANNTKTVYSDYYSFDAVLSLMARNIEVKRVDIIDRGTI